MTTQTPNESNEPAYMALFQRYGSPYPHAEQTFRIYATRPDHLNELEAVARCDKNAAADIERLQKLVEQLQSYRLALAERYAHLAAAPTEPVVKLRRKKNYATGKVQYYLTTCDRLLENGEEINLNVRTYPGTERRQALADFAAYKKARPGITAELDIEKATWER